MYYYKDIFNSLEQLALNHTYMSDIDKFGELEVYEWNKKEFSIIDNQILPEHKKIYQDCETFALRCIMGLIDLFGDSIRKDLKMVIGKWNGIGHGFFTFLAYNDQGVEVEYLWDNNLPCPLPLDIMLLSGTYQINNIFTLDTKIFYKFKDNEILNQLKDFNGVDVSRILHMKNSRLTLG